ncbi:MAG: type II secretion system protein [Patescibacteria group bacterium]
MAKPGFQSQKNAEHGFTLVEMLVYTAVSVILMTAVSVFVVWALNLQNASKALRETLEHAQRAMDQTVLEVRAAKSIYTPTTNSTQLSLETTKYLPPQETTTSIDFFICENRLCLKKESQNPVALTSDNIEITSITFQEVTTASPTSSVQITLQAQYKNPTNRPELKAQVTLTSTASLRSY